MLGDTVETKKADYRLVTDSCSAELVLFESRFAKNDVTQFGLKVLRGEKVDFEKEMTKWVTGKCGLCWFMLVYVVYVVYIG